MYKIRFYKHFFLFYGDRAIFLSPHFFADSIVPVHIQSRRSDGILCYRNIP